jgi:proline iminopeptidase
MRKLCLTLFFIFALADCLFAEYPLESNYTYTSDSVRIYYETQGEGVPIIMIAGGPGGSPSFFKESHKLWLTYGRLVYVHNRGRGRSQKLDSIPGAYTLTADALDIESVRKALGEEKVIVYGHSYGGMVALLYAATYPQNCLAVITTGTLAGAKSWQEHNIDGLKYFLRRHYPEEWEKIVKIHENGNLTSGSAYDSVWPKATEMYYYIPDNDALMQEYRRKTSDSQELGFNYQVYLCMVGDDPEWTVDGTLKGIELVPLLGAIDFQALIMGGRFDRICPVTVQKEIADRIKNSRLVIFDKSGHRPFIEEPLEFFQVTGEFLREIIEAK